MLPFVLTAALATWLRTRRIILLPFGLRLFLETAADSSRPGHVPTHDDSCSAEGTSLRSGQSLQLLVAPNRFQIQAPQPDATPRHGSCVRPLQCSCLKLQSALPSIPAVSEIAVESVDAGRSKWQQRGAHPATAPELPANWDLP